MSIYFPSRSKRVFPFTEEILGVTKRPQVLDSIISALFLSQVQRLCCHVYGAIFDQVLLTGSVNLK